MESKSDSINENSITPQEEIVSVEIISTENSSPENSPLESSPPDEGFLKLLKEKNSSEEKIRFCLDYMKQAISLSGKPDFKGFWEARRECLPIFKESMHPALRTELWKDYIEMTEEARRLKGILEEQTTFMVEQITIAIDALEQELSHIKDLIKKIPHIPLPDRCRSIESNLDFYQDAQREIVLYNSFATRVTSLRKELIDCEMRISMKNKLFKRLSAKGDEIFPKRKELMETLSKTFLADVEAFVARFGKDVQSNKTPYFILRDEIKYLQNAAKLLSIKTSVYLSSRNKLSECWDKLRELEVKRKEEMNEKQEEVNKQSQLVLEKIAELHARCQEKISFEQADKMTDAILEFMKSLPLSRDEVKDLKKKIQDAKDPLYEEQIKEQEAKVKKAAEKKADVANLLSEIDLFITEKHPEDLQEWISAKKLWDEKISSLKFSNEDREMLDRNLAAIDDAIFNMVEKDLLSKSPSFEALEEQLEKRLDYRATIKEKLEVHRKLVNESRLSFEKSIFYQDFLEEEKERLDLCDERIAALEELLEE